MEQEQKRIAFILGLMFLVSLYFLAVLTRYQLLSDTRQADLALPAFWQRQESLKISSGRAYIVDRNGVPLHAPTWESALVVLPREVKDQKGAAQLLAQLGIPLSESSRLKDLSVPTAVKFSLTSAELEAVLKAGVPGVSVVPVEKRYGPFSLARHLVGYAASVSSDDVLTGVSGLEKSLDGLLKGGEGGWVGTLSAGDGTTLPGTSIMLGPARSVRTAVRTTLDMSVQLAVENAMDENRVTRGAAVVLDVQTSQVRAMASRPNFDQSHPGHDLENAGHPFLNRAVLPFTPGSVWKPVVLSYLLERGIVDADEQFVCTGQLMVGDRAVKCGARAGGHGVVDVKNALAASCNSAFITATLRADAWELIEYALVAGFGVRTGVGLPEESKGTLPYASQMYIGDVANFAIGQGRLTVTPLQVASFFAAIAAGGVQTTPTLLPNQASRERRLFSEETARILAEALTLAAKEGTGEGAWVPGYGAAGKTGTAETGIPGKTHAWFAGWVPLISPKYVICVIVEGGGDGSTVAAPLFRDIAQRLLP